MLSAAVITSVHLAIVPLVCGQVAGPADGDDPAGGESSKPVWTESCGVLGDWSLRLLPWQPNPAGCDGQAPYVDDPCGTATYIAHPGSNNYAASSPVTVCSYDRLREAGAMLAVMLRNDSVPYPYNTANPAPETLSEICWAVHDLDYVFLDLEGGDLDDDVYANVVAVIDFLDAVGSNAVVGQYQWHAGEWDDARLYESQADISHFAERYLASGLTISMPIGYPYAAHIIHTSSAHFSGTSPNVEAALFWAPLERVSVAARALPEGHRLIPWIAPFIPGEGAQEPPQPTSLAALFLHMRMRGAAGFYTFNADGHPDLSPAQFRALAADAFTFLTPVLDRATSVEILNLGTDKNRGVEWSGLLTDREAVVLVSNLSDDDGAVVELPFIYGAPSTLTAPAGGHALYTFDLDPTPEDLNDDAWVDGHDIAEIIQSWGKVDGEPDPADFDGDGWVDAGDLLQMITAWGPAAP